MGLAFPYTYISCPCSDESEDTGETEIGISSLSQGLSLASLGSEHSQSPFDPRQPRSDFSLFPPDHLLYCEECKATKCPRCITEEQICYFCTSCLFETPSPAAAGEGYRCSRNCFDCPICFSQLTVNSTDRSAKEGPWILNCNYCMWTSLDIGIKLDKSTNIRAQLDRMANGGKPKPPSKISDVTDTGRRTSHLGREPSSSTQHKEESRDLQNRELPSTLAHDLASRFRALKSFYKSQLINESMSTDSSHLPGTGDLSYSSPASLARILSMYSTSGPYASSKKKAKPSLMREAINVSEGLQLTDPDEHHQNSSRIKSAGFSNLVSIEQRNFQVGPCGGNPDAHFVDELRPMPAHLTTKRAKRCKDCKHILVKPEVKPTSTRYRIKLLALSYIPSVTLKPLPQSNFVSGASPFPLSIPMGTDIALDPGKTSQWVLTLTNPLFDNVRVSLATPTVTPGKWGHRVTILCPQFEIGTNGDVWDEALNGKDRNRNQNAAVLSKRPSRDVAVAEAGKVYDKGRNWTSVVIEIVPASVQAKPSSKEEAGDGVDPRDVNEETKAEAEAEEEVVADEDVLEIPVRVRIEWKQGELDDGPSRKARLNEDTADDGKRELAYWMVLGVGRVRT